MPKYIILQFTLIEAAHNFVYSKGKYPSIVFSDVYFMFMKTYSNLDAIKVFFFPQYF